jgi:outer membrane lipoprotein-sorting protein
MMNKFAVAILALALLTTPALAKNNRTPVVPVSRPLPTATDDKADTTRIEDYLNQLSGFRAEFSQQNDNGVYRHGKLEMLRPGKMRVTYDAPSKDFIVADGHFINIWDGEMKQQTSVPVDASLGDILLREKIVFSGDVTVTQIERGAAKIAITVAQTNDKNAGQITFVFEDKPLVLRGWRIHDAQGQTTSVNLENTDFHATFSSGYFAFTPPNFGKSHRNGG